MVSSVASQWECPGVDFRFQGLSVRTMHLWLLPPTIQKHAKLGVRLIGHSKIACKYECVSKCEPFDEMGVLPTFYFAQRCLQVRNWTADPPIRPEPQASHPTLVTLKLSLNMYKGSDTPTQCQCPCVVSVKKVEMEFTDEMSTDIEIPFLTRRGGSLCVSIWE